jgi:hypothetical protein
MGPPLWKEGLGGVGEISQTIKNYSLFLLSGMVHLTRVELPIWGTRSMIRKEGCSFFKFLIGRKGTQ